MEIFEDWSDVFTESITGEQVGGRVLDVLEPEEESGRYPIKQAVAIFNAKSYKCVDLQDGQT